MEQVIFDNPAKGIQYRFSISEFRGVLYLSIREWFQDFEGQWVPTRNGLTFPYNLSVTYGLFQALTNILSDAEVLEQLLEKAEHDSTTDENSE